MCQRVHPDVKVCDVYAHGLLAHGRLVGVPGALVVIGEGDYAGADAEDHGGVDLAVGPRLAVAGPAVLGRVKVLGAAGEYGRLLLHGVDVLDHPAGHQVLPSSFIVIINIIITIIIILIITCHW